MNNLHVEITSRAIKTVLGVDDEPLLLDKNLLISIELGLGIIYLSWLGTYQVFKIPNCPEAHKNLYQNLRLVISDPYFDCAICNSRLFYNVLENMLNSSFLQKIDHCFEYSTKSMRMDDTERIQNAFMDVLNIPENVYFDYSDTDGVERFICNSSGYVLIRSYYGCCILQMDNDEDGLIGRMGYNSFGSIDESTRAILNRIFSYRLKLFYEDITCNDVSSRLMLD